MSSKKVAKLSHLTSRPKPLWAPTHDWALSHHWTKPPMLSAPIVKCPGLDESKPVTLTELTVDAKISGFVAKTTVVMKFHNPHPRVLEGELEFSLPEGATVSGYGLDVNGEIVDATIVEKQKARQVFEAEVRKGVDPGLVEMTKGNLFNTRVYPLPANGHRTIRLEYVSEVEATSDGARVHWHPLAIKSPVKFALTVTVVTNNATEAPQFWNTDFSGVPFELLSDDGGIFIYGVDLVEDGFKGGDSMLVVNVPTPDKGSAPFLVDRKVDDASSAHYFVIQDQIPAIAVPAQNVSAKRIAVFWDASLSQNDVNKDREIQLIESVRKQLLAPKGELDVYLFRNVLDQVVTFAADKSPVDFLNKVQYDGGTRLDSISLPDAKSKPVDFALLVTDGIASIGSDVPAFLSDKSCPPIYILGGSGKANNAPLLKYWASLTGGQYFHLPSLDDKLVLNGVGRRSFSFISATAEGVTDVLPNSITPVVLSDSGAVFTIVGKLVDKATTITVNYGLGKDHILHTSKYKLAQSGASATGLVPILWAQAKLQSLMPLEEANKDEIVKLGQDYHLVTPGTSLLVLESLSQHLEHHIEPAKTRTALYAEYQQHKRSEEASRNASIDSKLDTVFGWWQGRVDWWKTEFAPKPKPKIEHMKRKMSSMASGQSLSRSIASASPAPPPSLSDLMLDEPMMMESQSKMVREDSGPSPEMEICADEDASGEGRDFSEPPAPSGAAGAIQVKAWEPDTPYLTAIKGAADHYAEYLKQRKAYLNAPAFYFDCAHYFLGQNDKVIGLRVLTNIPELKLEDAQLLRILGYKLDELEQTDLAIEVFTKVLAIRPDEPQSHRDLGLVVEKKGDLQRAIDLLWEVVIGTNWRSSFEQVELTALHELNAIVAKAKHSKVAIKTPAKSDRFLTNLDVDLRITMGWDTDNTDIDIHVHQPDGQEANFSSNRTEIGGLVSRDFRDGYGPEEYLIKKAMPGEYIVKTHYFSSFRASLTGPTTIILKLFLNWGRPNQTCSVVLTRLVDSRDNSEIGRITIH